MFNLKTAWPRLCTVGTKTLPDNSFQKKISVRVNQLSLYLGLINATIGLSAYFLMTHSLWLLSGVVIEIMISPIPIYLNYRGRYSRATGALYAILCAATLFFCCLLGNLAEVNLMGVVLIASARFFFTSRRNRFWACLVAIAVVIGVQLNQWFVLIPQIAVGPATSSLLSRVAYIVAAFLVLSILAWNSYVNDFLRKRIDEGWETPKKLMSSALGKVYEIMLGTSFFLSNVFELLRRNDIKGLGSAVNVFMAACKYTQDVLQNIFEYESHLAGIPPEPEYKRKDIRQAFQEVVNVYSVFTEDRQVTLELRLSDDLSKKIFFDEEKLHLILANLVDNAIKFTHNGTTIVIDARLVGNLLLITVADGGDGVAEDIRHGIFEPGVSKKPNGPGLGLFVVHRLVQSLDGSVEVAKNDAGGATFVVFWLLPEAT